MKISIYVFFALFFMTSCKDQEKELPNYVLSGAIGKKDLNYAGAKTIKVDPKAAEMLRGAELIDTAWYVPLQIGEKSLLGKMGKVLMEDDKIFIEDRSIEAVYIFDEQGKFIRKIANKGRGPNEYIALRDFTVNAEDQEVLIYDDFGEKIFPFGFDGEHLKTEAAKFRFTNFENADAFTYYYLSNTDNAHLPLLKNKFFAIEKEGERIVPV